MNTKIPRDRTIAEPRNPEIRRYSSDGDGDGDDSRIEIPSSARVSEDVEAEESKGERSVGVPFCDDMFQKEIGNGTE